MIGAGWLRRSPLSAVILALALGAGSARAQCDTLDIDRGWGFHAADWGPTGPIEPGPDGGDSRWMRVELPLANLGAGRRAVFRRELRSPTQLRDRDARLRLLGAPCVAAIFLDGEPVAIERRGFDVVADLGSTLGDGERHELLVECERSDAPAGARDLRPVGITGGARLDFVGEFHFDRSGGSGRPLFEWERAVDGSALLRLEPAVVRRGDSAQGLEFRAALTAPDRSVVGRCEAVLPAQAEGGAAAGAALAVERPLTWSAAEPNLYGLSLELVVDGEVVDEQRFTTAPRDLGPLGGVGVVTFATHSTNGIERAAGRAIRRDAVRLAELGAVVALDPSMIPSEVFLAECDLRGVDVLLAERAGATDAQRRHLRVLAAHHPCVARVDEVDLEAWSRARTETRASLPVSSRSGAAATRRDHAEQLLARLRAARDGFLAPPAIGGEGRGILSAERLPRWAYHRIRAAAGEPTALAAASWAELARGGALTVYSSGDAVEVLVDGQSIGRRRPWRGRARFDAAPAAGERVVVRTWRGGWIEAERAVEAPGPPAQVLLVADEMGLALSGVESDSLWVHALVLDERGNLCEGFDGVVTCSLLGAGEIVGDHRPAARAGVASIELHATGPDPITLVATVVTESARIDSNRLGIVPEG